MKHTITIFSDTHEQDLLAECSCGETWTGELNVTIDGVKNHVYQNRLRFLKEIKRG